MQTYAPANLCGFFGIAATPDGKYFLAGGGAFYAPMYKFDIASGHVVDSFFAIPNQSVNIHGIAVYGDELKNCFSTQPNLHVAKSINTYPNPSNGNFILETKLTGKLTVRLYNKLGQPVYKKEFNFSGTSNTIPLNLRNLSPGIYFVQIIKEGKVVSEKIVIN